MSEIKIFRLSTGEDVIAQKLENKNSEYNTETTLIKQAFIIVPMQSKPGGPIQLALTPYSPYSEEDTITIKNNNIISEVNPKIDIKNSYNQHLGTGIIEIKKPKLLVD
jgi:hypothetical protein